MFRFLFRLYNKLHKRKSQSNKPSSKEKRSVANKSEENKSEIKKFKNKNTPEYKILIIGGISMLLISMALGGIYATFILEPLLKNHENLEKAILFATEGKVEKTKLFLAKQDQILILTHRLSSTHAHLNLFGLISVALAGNVDKIDLNKIKRLAASLLLITGGCLLPLGLFLQPLVSGILGKLVSGVGGFFVMASMTIYLIAFFQMKSKGGNYG